MEGSAANTAGVFLLTPLREGRHTAAAPVNPTSCISTHAPAGGATRSTRASRQSRRNFYSRPCGRGDTPSASLWRPPSYFYSRPCGRGDQQQKSLRMHRLVFLLTPLREGRPDRKVSVLLIPRFLLTPLREGRPTYSRQNGMAIPYFYSRPCGRGDKGINPDGKFFQSISTHAPAGGATETGAEYAEAVDVFLLTPLREGRHSSCRPRFARTTNISTHAPAGGATGGADHRPYERHISTHAPAGGATVSRM